MSQNLASQLKKYLPPPALALVKIAGQEASKLGQGLYLVGGVVRDMFLARPNFDLDLVIEGDAIKLAEKLSRDSQANLLVHSRFGTAKLSYPDFSLDLATARRETYSKPGALPAVQPGTLTDDLYRRDFSINAMALCLTPQHFGELIDLYQGEHDLNHRIIRILHPKSFIDDATRILRAIRYEQRLGFKLEPETVELLSRDIAMFNTISGDRLRHELELILKEDHPERILRRAEELEVLSKLHPSLKGNGWLSKMFSQARQMSRRASPFPLYLCLLIYNLTEEENEQFVSCFNFPKRLAQAMRHTLQLKAQLHTLAKTNLKPSEVYQLLYDYVPAAIQANSLASKSPVAKQRLQVYLTKLRYVKPLLDGKDLKRIGISPGPQLGEILSKLHEAKLNRKTKTRQDEEKLVRSWRRIL